MGFLLIGYGNGIVPDCVLRTARYGIGRYITQIVKVSQNIAFGVYPGKDRPTVAAKVSGIYLSAFFWQGDITAMLTSVTTASKTGDIQERKGAR